MQRVTFLGPGFSLAKLVQSSAKAWWTVLNSKETSSFGLEQSSWVGIVWLCTKQSTGLYIFNGSAGPCDIQGFQSCSKPPNSPLLGPVEALLTRNLFQPRVWILLGHRAHLGRGPSSWKDTLSVYAYHDHSGSRWLLVWLVMGSFDFTQCQGLLMWLAQETANWKRLDSCCLSYIQNCLRMYQRHKNLQNIPDRR